MGMDYGPVLHVACMISGFHHEVDKICAFLDITQCIAVIPYQRLDTACRFHF
jgi:hypothetical protein